MSELVLCDIILDRPKRVFIMHARCCEKCNWVIHCLGKLLNSTNLVEATSDVWHIQDIASGVMRWYGMQVRDADCVLVLASNKMKVLNEDVHTPNKDVNDCEYTFFIRQYQSMLTLLQP